MRWKGQKNRSLTDFFVFKIFFNYLAEFNYFFWSEFSFSAIVAKLIIITYIENSFVYAQFFQICQFFQLVLFSFFLYFYFWRYNFQRKIIMVVQVDSLSVIKFDIETFCFFKRI